MTTLTLERPGLNRFYANLLDGLLYAPARIAHAKDLQREAEAIFAKSDAELERAGTTREQALLALAQKA